MCIYHDQDPPRNAPLWHNSIAESEQTLAKALNLKEHKQRSLNANFDEFCPSTKLNSKHIIKKYFQRATKCI